MPFWKKKSKQLITAKKISSPKPAPKSEPTPQPKNESSKNPRSKTGFRQQDARKEFLTIFRRLTSRYRAWDIWRDFVTMLACSISNAVDRTHFEQREARYMRIIQKYNKQEQALFPELAAQTVMALEENPEQDFLGDIFMELNLGNESGGQFFTPYHVCDLMAKVAMENDMVQQVKEHGYITINDPCCGAGATLIAGVHEARKQLEKQNLNYQNHVLVIAQDIDEVVAMMCYIQLSLLGIAAYIKVANTFTEPMIQNDNLEKYWFTPIYFSDVWTMRRALHMMGELFERENPDKREE